MAAAAGGRAAGAPPRHGGPGHAAGAAASRHDPRSRHQRAASDPDSERRAAVPGPGDYRTTSRGHGGKATVGVGKMATDTYSQQQQQQQQQQSRLFVALFDYDPQTMSPNQNAINDELPFTEGQIIKVGYIYMPCDGRLVITRPESG